MVRLHESKRCGHYIAFRKIEEQWLWFDDAVIHHVQLQRSYNVNLVIYRSQDRDAYISPLDLMQIPSLGRSVILNRKTPNAQSVAPSQKSSSTSGRPSLIMYEAGSSTRDTIDSAMMKPEMPTHQQPGRASKEYVVYYGVDSQSSDKENSIDKTHPNSEYIPDNPKGTYVLYISPEYFPNKCLCNNLKHPLQVVIELATFPIWQCLHRFLLNISAPA